MCVLGVSLTAPPPAAVAQEIEQWSPALWGSHRRFGVRILNLSKDKAKLLSEGDEGR